MPAIQQTAGQRMLQEVANETDRVENSISGIVGNLEETLQTAASKEAEALHGIFSDSILERARELVMSDVEMFGSAIRKDFSSIMAKNFIYKLAGVNFADGGSITPALHTAEHLMTLAVSLVNAPGDKVLDILTIATKELAQLEGFLRSSVANVDQTATTAASDALKRQPNSL